MSLYEDILGGLQLRTTKAEVIEGYQAQYKGRGQAGWKQRIVHDLAQLTGMKPKNLEKRFDTQRRGNPEKRNAEQYKTLGESLPPLPPENGFHVSGVIWVRYSEECEERYPDYDLSASEAALLVRMAHAGMAEQAASNGYNDKDIDDPNPYGLCAEPQLTFTPR